MSESTKVKSDSDSVTGTNSADPNENNAGKDEPNEDCGENEGRHFFDKVIYLRGSSSICFTWNKLQGSLLLG